MTPKGRGMTERRLLVTGGSGFIGSNFVETVLGRGEQHLLNLDIVPPQVEAQRPFYRQLDLLDRAALRQAFAEFQPTHVVHWAGRTDMLGKGVEDYAANHVGTENVLAAAEGLASLRHVVFTSSQFVVGPGAMPVDDLDFRPHTIYGESKVLSEKAVRAANPRYTWTLIRPTNIWGKRHPRYPSEFWRVLKQGRYVHPGGRRVTRCYGYVGNVVEQVLRILDGGERFRGKVFYVGDAPVDLFEWTDAFSKELIGRPVRVVPSAVLRGLARVGDLVVLAGGKFPIFTSRFRSMTEDYVTPMEPTFAALGPSPISMIEGVRETVDWLRSQDAFWR